MENSVHPDLDLYSPQRRPPHSPASRVRNTWQVSPTAVSAVYPLHLGRNPELFIHRSLTLYFPFPPFPLHLFISSLGPRPPLSIN